MYVRVCVDIHETKCTYKAQGYLFDIYRVSLYMNKKNQQYHSGWVYHEKCFIVTISYNFASTRFGLTFSRVKSGG